MFSLSDLRSQRMLQFALGRLLRSFISLLLFQIILFALIWTLSQTLTGFELPASEFLEPQAATQAPQEPAWRQFLDWITGFFSGDLGESINPGGGTVAEILAAKLPRTLLLLLPATLIGFSLGIWLGKRIAWRRRTWLEFVVTLGGTAAYTSFPPWLAFVFVQVFALSFEWFPPEKLIDPNLWVGLDISLDQVIVRMLRTLSFAILAYLLIAWLTRNRIQDGTRLRVFGGIGIAVLAVLVWIVSGQAPLAMDVLYHLALPLATLILLSFGETMLVMKTIMAETVEEEYVSVARAKGLAESKVLNRHAARVAIVPVLARFVVHLPYVIIGSFVLESVFAWDGMGQELVRAADDNDLAVLLGVLSLVGVAILVAHFALDLLAAWLDPRLREISQTRSTYFEAGD